MEISEWTRRTGAGMMAVGIVRRRGRLVADGDPGQLMRRREGKIEGQIVPETDLRMVAQNVDHLRTVDPGVVDQIIEDQIGAGRKVVAVRVVSGA